MNKNISLDSILKRSENIVARDVAGEFILIPLTSGIADLNEVFSLNETGRAIWEQLNGELSLSTIADKIQEAFDVASLEEAQKDCLGFTEELLKRKMLIVAS